MSNLDRWDREIKPYLTRIRWRSNALRYDVASLAKRPDFETMAQADLADIERELERALARVRSAKAAYFAKELEMAA